MKIVSIMGSGSLGKEVDLETLVEELRDEVGESLEANFQSPGIVTVKFGDNSPAFSIYRTGSFQIRGALGHDGLNDAVDQLLEILSNIDFETGEVEFEEKTAVFMHDVHQGLELEILAVHLGLEYTEYEPEQFPGLVYRPPKHEATLLIFSSGKVLVVGTAKQEVARSVLKSLLDALEDSF
ncbi:transcription factor [Halogeometricum borinquense]|uniref:TATA-box binding protein (TBP), component of TFIID and TFIIIB n=1 Tax=Halogeometricum borinquense (strain ATCC 700274 / DSM 11551 / JCM 10706 / KCTC 4070 / PR3) TaxID=469382 RepID=E4NSB4_HALBP|nr:transcription factor [Halogeometricum borinquense]ADQ66903.1 TATA-box binding protein (TBP), component of TFIID and TFIIIB [Halogeometricum borinquense DSM 11551]ELY30410.1 transcription factor [Halogeometricum borinquense DSM 11551]QIQ76216.1 transcription factor [Halogeometricum borinquense]